MQKETWKINPMDPNKGPRGVPSCKSHDIFLQDGKRQTPHELPIPSMYGMFPYIWLIFMVNVGKHTSPMDPLGYTQYRDRILYQETQLATYF